MLQYAAVYPKTLELLRTLMHNPIFAKYNLVGAWEDVKNHIEDCTYKYLNLD